MPDESIASSNASRTAPPAAGTTTSEGPESVEQLKQTIAVLEQELVACQRLAAIGNLAAMAAHEFRNLMTPLVARCEAALGLDDPAFREKTIDRSLTQAQRAVKVSERLLEFAHDEAEAPTACSVAEAVHEAIETITRPFDKDGISLQVSVPEDLRVTAQPDLFCQVFVNLLLNAREAMKGVRGPLTIRATRADDAIQIEIVDSGRGFSPEKIEQVVNPFFAADPTQRPNDWQEVGLGLSVCRMIAYRQGARMAVSTNDGAGCTFHLHWPAAD